MIVMPMPMAVNSAPFSVDVALKWLGTPRAACSVMITCSSAAMVTMTADRAPSTGAPAGAGGAAAAPAVAAALAIDAANLAGFSQTDAPISWRASIAMSTRLAAEHDQAAAASSSSGRVTDRRRVEAAP